MNWYFSKDYKIIKQPYALSSYYAGILEKYGMINWKTIKIKDSIKCTGQRLSMKPMENKKYVRILLNCGKKYRQLKRDVDERM